MPARAHACPCSCDAQRKLDQVQRQQEGMFMVSPDLLTRELEYILRSPVDSSTVVK